MNGSYLVAAVFLNVVFAGLCGYIGSMKRWPFIVGAALGLVLNCIGLVIVIALPERQAAPAQALRMPPRLYRPGDAPVVPGEGAQPVPTASGWVDPRTLPDVERVAGWYDDPYGLFTYRYWDGNDWTDHTSNGA